MVAGIVLDPFCGCGTTVVAAHQLKRQFVGIDISLYTVQNIVRTWLTENGLKREQIHVAGIPQDMAQVRQLAEDDPFAFESFAVELCHPGFKANVHQHKDGGIDGRGVLLHPAEGFDANRREVIVQCKAGKPTIDQVRSFAWNISTNVHKSRDGGVDGKGILLHPAEGFDANRREVIVQCKAGKPTIDQVRSFAWNITKPKSKAVAGVFITLDYKVDGNEVWTPEMKKIARSLKRFKVAGATEKYPRLQHWHIGQWWWKTPSKRLPCLPALADPLSGKEMTALRQTGFLTKQYGK